HAATDQRTCHTPCCALSLLVSVAPLLIDLARGQERFPRLSLPGTWPSALSYFLLDERDTVRFAAGASLNTDDRLPLEFSAPRTLYVDTASQNLPPARCFRRAQLQDARPYSRAPVDAR